MEMRKTIAGAALIVVQAAVIGLAANAVNPRRLAWVRVPLSETRRVATSGEVLPPSPPAPAPTEKAGQPGDAPQRAPETTRPARPAVTIQRPARSLLPQPTAMPPEGSGKTKDISVRMPARPTPSTASRPATGAEKRAVRPERPVAATPTPEPGPRKVAALFTTLPDAKALFDRKDVVFVDARRKEDYDLGHITGALSLFVEDVDVLYESVMGTLPKDRTVVTYCSDAQCDTAIRLADALVARGHTRVFILLEGIPGWKGAGYPTETGGVP